jgi:hypothetical protein
VTHLPGWLFGVVDVAERLQPFDVVVLLLTAEGDVRAVRAVRTAEQDGE